MGARIFEKHIGLETKKFKLNKYSVNSSQMNIWLSNLSKTIDRIGKPENREKFLKNEKENLKQFKRGVFLKKNKKKTKGEEINIKDIYFAFPSIKNQVFLDSFSKFNKIIAHKNIDPNTPILNSYVKIFDHRKKIEEIRDKIKNLINISKVVINKNSKLEISHHYGLDKFEKFGMCMITILNLKYCKKLIFIFKNQKHPAQYHKRKQETFFVLHGKVRLQIKKNKKIISKILKAGDLATILPNEIHSFTGMSRDGCIIEELSTKSLKNDLYYIDKKINKNVSRKSFISLNL